MTTKYDHIASTKYLSNLCKDGTPLRGRIALLSFPNDVSAKRIDTAIMLIEYAQIMALMLRAVTQFYSEQATNSVELYNVFTVFVKIFSPGNILPLNKDGIQTINRVLEICLGFYLLRISLFFYIIWLAFQRKTDSGFLVKLWQWIFQLQTKVFFHAFTSVYSNIYQAASLHLFEVDSSHRNAYMAGCITHIIFEFAFSLVLTVQFTNILPFKRFSASKNNSLELNLLLQKFANHMLGRMFSFSRTMTKWTYGLMNIIFGLVRIYHVFQKLPLYNYKALKLQISLLVATFTLSIASFANVAVDLKTLNMNFIIITWFILTLLCIPVALAFLEKKLWALVFEKGINAKRNPETLIHKIIFIKQIIRENKQPTKNSSKSDIHHLLWSSLTLTPTFSNSQDLENKSARNKIFMHYTEDLMAQFPKNNFIRLYAAYRYARKNKLYGLSIKTLTQLKNSRYPTVVTSKSILKYFIQNKTKFDYQNGAYLWNLYDYCKGVADLSNLKLKMAEQAKVQWTLCHEIGSVGPDLAEILRLGNKAYRLKREIHKGFAKIFEQVPDYYIKPSLLYASYNLFMGYNPEEASKYKEIASKKLPKYHKQFENERLIQENLFQEDTYLIIVSGEKETSGVMPYVAPGLIEIFGRDLTGSQAFQTTPLFLRPNGAQLVKSLIGQHALLVQNTERFSFFYHIKGYLSPIYYSININPSIYGGLSFLFICRVANKNKEYILLNDEGEIDSFTKNIGELLGLLSHKDGCYDVENKVPISKICPELMHVDHAFNFFAAPPAAQKIKPVNFEEAKEVFRIYSEEGKDIILTPVTKARPNSLQYHCTVKPLLVGIKVGKILTLERIHVQNQEIVVTENNNLSKREETSEENEDLREDVNSEWINFDRLKSEPHITTTTRNDNFITVQHSFSSPRNFLVSSPRIPLMIERGNTETKEQLLLFKEDDHGYNSTHSNEGITKANTLQETKRKTRQERYKPRWLKNHQPKVSKLYQQGLEKPYRYPFFYKAFITGLYALSLIVFVMYLYICINMHKGISDLQVSKQILRMAEARNNYIGILDSTTRFLWTYATSPATLAKYLRGTLISLPVLIYINQFAVGLLETQNDNLFELTSSLDAQQSEYLFKKDVRMFDTNSTDSLDTYLSLTSFQATDRIIESSLRAFDLLLTDMKSAVPYLKFMLNNMLNDMLIKNVEISTSFLDSLHEKKIHFDGWITTCFGISLSFLILLLAGFIYVLYLQAKNESSNLIALTKLKSDSICYLKQDFLVFHDLILEDQQSQKLTNSSSDPFSQIATLKRTKQHQHQARQFPVYRGLWTIYYLYLLKVCFLIMIPVSLFLANFVLFKKYLDQLSTKATQISFIEQMNSRLGMLSGSFLEVTAENDTTIIFNQKASISLSYQISDISAMIQSISDTLGVGVTESNDVIQDILYGNACSYLKASPFAFTYCQELANYQENAGLINLMSNLESSIKLVYSNFMNSNRSAETLISLQVDAYNSITSPVFLATEGLNNLIATELNKDFEHIVVHSQDLNIKLNTAILVIIVVESLITHFLIINRLKQKETQFKHLLGLFPASVVLQNFILKSYLTKASNQNFNSFRDNA